MKPRRTLLGCSAITLLVLACRHVPVRLEFDQGEVFTGTVAVSKNHRDHLKLVSGSGVTGEGDIVFGRPHEGTGIFHTADGRHGTFRITTDGTSYGHGEGWLSGQHFVFSAEP